MRFAVTLIGVVCIAFVVIGCGGSEDDTIAKSEYVERADAICGKAEAKRDAAVKAAVRAQKEVGKVSTQSFGERLVVDVALPPLEQMTEELADLDQPKDGASDAEAMVTSFEAGIEQAEDEPAEILNGTVDPFKDAKRDASALGLKECSQL